MKLEANTDISNDATDEEFIALVGCVVCGGIGLCYPDMK
jgi:hypothetical protein